MTVSSSVRPHRTQGVGLDGSTDYRSRGQDLTAGTLSAVAAHFGESGEVDTQVVCVGRRRQWSRWGNVWHSSAIRSTVYMLGAPVQGARGVTRRGAAG